MQCLCTHTPSTPCNRTCVDLTSLASVLSYRPRMSVANTSWPTCNRSTLPVSKAKLMHLCYSPSLVVYKVNLHKLQCCNKETELTVEVVVLCGLGAIGQPFHFVNGTDGPPRYTIMSFTTAEQGWHQVGNYSGDTIDTILTL